MTARPRLVVVQDYAAMSTRAARIIAETVTAQPGAAIAVPTGSSAIGMFQELIAAVDRGQLSFGDTQVFCLDEHLGVTAGDPVSLTGWLFEAFLTPARIPAANIHTLPSMASDLAAAAAQYEAEIAAAGGLELTVLGLGGNGHIAYNEPGSPGDSRTSVQDLTEESIEQARGYFGGRAVPSKAMTVGVGTLLESRNIVLIVSGASKAEMLRASLTGPQTTAVPASFLQRVAGKVTVIADRAAASLL